jgi:hypothetical protein
MPDDSLPGDAQGCCNATSLGVQTVMKTLASSFDHRQAATTLSITVCVVGHIASLLEHHIRATSCGHLPISLGALSLPNFYHKNASPCRASMHSQVSLIKSSSDQGLQPTVPCWTLTTGAAMSQLIAHRDQRRPLQLGDADGEILPDRWGSPGP